MSSGLNKILGLSDLAPANSYEQKIELSKAINLKRMADASEERNRLLTIIGEKLESIEMSVRPGVPR